MTNRVPGVPVPTYTIVEAPTHLGLRAGGGEGLPEALLAAGLGCPPATGPSMELSQRTSAHQPFRRHGSSRSPLRALALEER
jgi:hypothetical protein